MKLISKKPRYNLSLVVQETGLTPDTLRVWEKRYNLPQPERTRGGHRLYSDYDLAAIHWLQRRQEEGMRISQAVEYWRELAAAGTDPLQEHPNLPGRAAAVDHELSGQALSDLRRSWVERVCRYDELGSEQVLNQAFAQFPLEVVCTELISPALSEIGSSWYAGEISPQQEHFASELAVRKLQALIASAPQSLDERKLLLACPPGELHIIPLLMLNLLLRYRGRDVLYLGANVPVERLRDTVIDTRPTLVVFSASRLPSAASMLKAVRLLREYQIPSAFGGWVFEHNRRLVPRIPAHYLGESLQDASSALERLLASPALSQEQVSEPDRAALHAYQDNLDLLNHRVLENLNGARGELLHRHDLQEANQQLAAAVIAALEFGDISLIKEELDWIKGLLSDDDLPDNLFKRYLAAYSTACREVLRGQDHPLTSWLESLTAKQEPEEE